MPDASGTTTAPATLSLYDASGRVIETERCAGVQLAETQAVEGVDYTGLPGCEAQVKMVVSNPGTVLSATRTFYDAVGRVQFSVDARGAVTQDQYDAAGRRTNVLVYTTYTFNPMQAGTNAPDPTGPSQSTSYTYDANGNQTSVTDANGHTTRDIYDAADRLIEVDEPAPGGGTVSQFNYYDGLGRKIEQTDAAGVSTAYTYDFRGLLTSVTLAAGTTQQETTVYGYDQLGNEIRQTDAAGRTTTFGYDALGRKTGRTLPGGQSEGFAYDPAGDVIDHTNFNGVVITNEYDADNRLTNCSAPGYEAAYAYNATGQRTNMADASGTTAWSYDGLNQLTNQTVAWHNGPTVALNYAYDAFGDLTNLWSDTADGVSNAYQYDLLGRLTNVLADGVSIAGYGYDAVGNLQSVGYADGVTNLYEYDSMNRLTNLVWKRNGSPRAGFAYTLGPTGNRTALAETVNGTSRSYTWSYDYLYRLTSEGIGNLGTVNYGLDAVGNRTNRTSGVSGIADQTPTFDADNRLQSDTYDPDGNTVVSGPNVYEYDALDHLTNVNNGQILLTYNGDGARMSKTVGGVTTYYLVDDQNPSGYAQVLEEFQGSALSRVYNYGLNLISQRQVASGTVSYYGYDGQGSTRFLMDSSGNVTDTYFYDAYGTLLSSTGTTPNDYLYDGQQWDSDLGLYYNRARYLNTDTGRFWTMDTFGGDNQDPLSLHKYLYGVDDPVNRNDPGGHYGETIGNILAPLGMAEGINVQNSVPAFSMSYPAMVSLSIHFDQIRFSRNPNDPNGHNLHWFYHSYLVLNSISSVEGIGFRGGPSRTRKDGFGYLTEAGSDRGYDCASGFPDYPTIPTDNVIHYYLQLGYKATDNASYNALLRGLKQAADHIEAMHLPYEVTKQNSNSFTYTLLNKIGITAPPPPDFTPGWRHILY